jgi:hypothetical protein
MKTISTVIADDRIAAELEFSGTNTGPLKVGDQPEIPATNKKVVNRGCVFGKVRNGKFIEIKSYPDLAGMMMQLGLFEMHEAHAYGHFRMCFQTGLQRPVIFAAGCSSCLWFTLVLLLSLPVQRTNNPCYWQARKARPILLPTLNFGRQGCGTLKMR